MKKLLSICLLCLSVWQAKAENRFYIEDFSIDPDATVDVSIMLDNDVTTFASFQADMYLPDGLELVEQYDEDNEEYFTFSLTTRARNRMAIGSSVQPNGAVRLMLTQTIGSTLQTIKETSGALVTFQLKASSSASGRKYIDLKDVVFTTTTTEQYNFSDERTTVTVTGTNPPEPQGSNRLYIENLTLNAGETIDVSILLDNEVTDFASFQADMYLSEGLELVEQYDEDNEEYFTFALTTRARNRMAIGSATQSDGAVRLMLTQTIGSTVQTIKETSGALVTFKLKANASASGTRYIDLKNIVFTTATSQQYNFDDERATITVNGGSTPISQLTITANVLNLLTGTSQALMVTPSNASVTWTSSNTAVATVSNAGVVTGVAPGSATITCSSGADTSAPFTVNVISLGDVNRDSIISIADVTALVNIILGKTNL